MNVWDILLIVFILAALTLAVVRCVRVRKRGGTLCGGNCAGCGASCPRRRPE